jgi:hypothetical protein
VAISAASKISMVIFGVSTQPLRADWTERLLAVGLGKFSSPRADFIC